MSIHVQLDRFEGPLGLLLHLIREQEMDIFNINITHITRQYLEYIKTMRRLDLEVAGDFVAMAAQLLHIKSRMLLPQYNEEGEEISEDPRKELVQKLLEYKKFRELSADLYKRALLGRDVFPRVPTDDIEAAEEGELILEEKPLFSLIASFRIAMKNMKKTVHRVGSQLQSISDRIMEIKDRLTVGNRVTFRDLITAQEGRAGQVLVTFLSLLELAKMGFISVFQNENFGDIHVETKKVIDRDVVSQVESYDSVNAEATADSIMANAQLSLTEPEANFEGEEAPVVVASPADAASDEEILAEEALLEKIEGQHIIAHDTEQTLLPIEVASDADIELELARMAAEDRGEVFVPPTAVTAVEDPPTAGSAVELASLDSVSLETFNLAPAESATRPIEFSPQMIQEMPMEFMEADEAGAPLMEDAQHSEPVEIMPEAMIEPDVEQVMETVADENFLAADESSHETVEPQVNSALSAAISAFDAFNDIKPDINNEPVDPGQGDPEVNT